MEAEIYDALIATFDALPSDSLQATRPVNLPIERPEEIESHFDSIAYYKGKTFHI